MNRILLTLFFISSFAIGAVAQSEDNLRRQFEGKTVMLRIDMPASKDGVSVYPDRSQAMDYRQYNERLQGGISIQSGASATVNAIKVKRNQIEVQFIDARKQSATFNIYFARLDSWMLTPATLIESLNRYVEFTTSDKNMAKLQESSAVAAGFVKDRVVHLGPRHTFLKEGLKTQEVISLLGQPALVSERTQDGKLIATYEFQRGDGRVLIADFVGGTLVSSRIEVRSAGAVALLMR